MSRLVIALLGALALGVARAPQDIPAATQAAIERFAIALRATGLSFEKSTSGKSYVVPYDHDGRRRTVFVALRPNEPSDLFVHTIYTAVWTGGQPPTEAMMRTVFATTRKLGAYYLLQDTKGNWEVRFAVWFDATDLGPETKAGDAAAKRLRAMIAFVDTVGTETEKALAR